MANLRSIQLPKDIDAMLSLAQAGFQYPENPAWSIQTDDMAGMVEQIRVIKRVWPAIRFLQFFSPVLRDALHGFIFQDDGKPVGMINFTRQGNDDEWLITSVTVQPTYRRCGIARKLVETTINDLRARKAKAIFLVTLLSESHPLNGRYGLNWHSASHRLTFSSLSQSIGSAFVRPFSLGSLQSPVDQRT
jgi:ribosomal protein S18 acetylase RimI-like enzyme